MQSQSKVGECAGWSRSTSALLVGFNWAQLILYEFWFHYGFYISFIYVYIKVLKVCLCQFCSYHSWIEVEVLIVRKEPYYIYCIIRCLPIAWYGIMSEENWKSILVENIDLKYSQKRRNFSLYCYPIPRCFS